jgi:hypothetical protein
METNTVLLAIVGLLQAPVLYILNDLRLRMARLEALHMQSGCAAKAP